MKTRLATPAALIDIGYVQGLDYLRQDAAGVHIGALVRHRDVEVAALPAGHAILHDAARCIADVQVRNRGTVCGALVQADPAGDWAPVMLALRAELEIIGAAGARVTPLRGFFRDFFTVDLQPGEVVRELRLRAPVPGQTGAYLAFKRRAGDYAIAAVAVSLVLDARGRCVEAGVAIGNAGATPLVAPDAERLLTGSVPDEETVMTAVADAVAATADPSADINGSVLYKREVFAVLARRALAVAVRRGRGEVVAVEDHV